jgi:HlyD family secretion protein
MQILNERRKPLGFILLLAAAIGLGVWWSLPRQVAARDSSRLEYNGTIEADEVEIGAQRPARLVKYLVEEGQSVKAGQAIATLDTSELEAQFEQAQGAAATADARLKELLRGARSEELRRAEAQVAQARSNVEGARRTLANAQKGYARRTPRRQALDAAVAQRDVAAAAVRQAEAALGGAKSGLGTTAREFGTTLQLRQSRDAARQQYETAQATYRSAKAQLQQLLNGARGEQVRASEAQVGQAAAALDAADKESTNAKNDLTRSEKLYKGHALSDQQLEAAQVRARTARARLDQAKQAKIQADERLAELKNGARPEEIDAARAAVDQAQAAVEGGRRTLDNMQQALDLRLGAQGQLDVAKTQRQVAEAQLASARAALQGAELAVHTTRTAHDDALDEKQGADTALQQYQFATAQLRVAETQLEQLRNGATSEQINQARGQAVQARGVLNLARVQKEQSVIRAPRAGVVTKHVAQVGETLTPGATVAKLVPLEDAYVTLYVPLTDLGRVKLGQKVEVTTETFKDKKYPGHVVEISDTPEFTPRNVQTLDEREKLVYQVKVAVNNKDRELKPGMPASATIQLQ